MKVQWKVVPSFVVATFIDVFVRAVQDSLPPSAKWLSLDGLAFVITFTIAFRAGARYRRFLG